MHKKIKILFFILVLAIIFSPVLSHAAGLVNCGKGAVDATGKIIDECTFSDVFDLINRLVNFILVALAIPIAAIMFAYAGFTMLAVGGESAGGIEKAKTVFMDTVIGLALVAGSWIIVHTILLILGHEASWIGF